jgi:hypothetical protein
MSTDVVCHLSYLSRFLRFQPNRTGTYMLRLACMCGAHRCVPVRMYSHVLQRQKSCKDTKKMLNFNVVSRAKCHALSNGALKLL